MQQTPIKAEISRIGQLHVQSLYWDKIYSKQQVTHVLSKPN